MPDVIGRRRAVFVAFSIAAITLSILPFAASSATAPPGINRFLYALGQVESGGNYYARNSSSGAYGKYQIMPSNWPSWAKLYVGSSTAKWTPANQEAVARGKVTALWHWLDSWENVAHWWLTGSGDRNRSHWSSFSRSFVAKVMKIYANVSESTAAANVKVAPAAPAKPPIGAAAVTRHIDEMNAGITWAGRWGVARHDAYAGNSVQYSETDGSSVTYPFYGNAVAWIGPTGPTRGKARVTVDGKVVATVDLRKNQFTPRVTIFGRRWKTVGSHTLTITVVGNGRPVAIDEFTVSR